MVSSLRKGVVKKNTLFQFVTALITLLNEIKSVVIYHILS